MNYVTGPSSENRDEWLLFRRGKISATDVAKLAGSNVKGWETLRAEKLSGDQKFRGNKYTKHGTERESTISDHLDVMLGMKHNTHVLVSADNELFVATPDLIDVERNRVGDIKTSKWDGEKWSKVPQDYSDQLQWQMFVTGADSAVLAVEYHDDFVPVFMDPHLFYEDRNPDRIEFLKYLAERFSNFETLTPLDELMIEREQRLQEIKPLQESVADIEQKIKDHIGARPYFKHVSPVGGIVWSRGEAKRTFDKNAVLEKLAADRGVEPTKANLKTIEDEFTKLGNRPKPSLRITTPEVAE